MASTSTSRPATPVRVPKAAGTYSPTIVDPSLRSEINTLLLQGGHIIKIQETLLHALQVSSTNWPSLIQSHALSLLRSGECHTFPDLMARVMADIKADTLIQAEQLVKQHAQSTLQAANPSSSNQITAAEVNGGKSRNALPGSKVNGVGKAGNALVKANGRGEEGQSLAMPANVLEEGIRVTRECLEVVCEFQP